MSFYSYNSNCFFNNSIKTRFKAILNAFKHH
nr:MAG TPA: hypothetical protein [Caudoviricetes sp.]